MSIRISGDKLAIRRTTDLPAAFDDFTVTLCVKLQTARPTHVAHMIYAQSTGGAHAEAVFAGGAAGLSVLGADSYQSTVSAELGQLVAGGSAGENWYFVAMRGSAAGAGGLKFYFKPVVGGVMQTQTITNSPGAAGWSFLILGDAPFDLGAFGTAAWWFDGYLAHCKVYDRALSDAEVSAEAAQGTVASATDLISYHSFSSMTLATALTPDSGSGAFTAFQSNPTTSADNPVFASNPVYSGTAQIPGGLSVVGSGAPQIIRSSIYWW